MCIVELCASTIAIEVGRLLRAIQSAKLFEAGFVLVGTMAYQLYPPIVGAFLSASASRTQDADFAVSRFALPRFAGKGDIQAILRNADPSFEPRWHRDDKLPRAFISTRGLLVELLMTMGRSESPVEIKALNCAAQPLRYMEYLIQDPIEVVALHGNGVRVSLPQPARYAVHKMIVHALRSGPKSHKDLLQARELIEILRARDPAALEEAIEDAEKRGRTSRTLVRNGLAKLAIA